MKQKLLSPLLFSGMMVMSMKVVFASEFPEEALSQPFGVLANHAGFNHLTHLERPSPQEDGKIPTLNKTGLMTHDRDPFSEAFIDFATVGQKTVLEVGAAYGITTILTLEKGVESGGITYVANDIDPGHLRILQQETPDFLREHLYLNHASFPTEMNFSEGTFDAILLCRVIHLFTPEAMEEGLKKIYQWLKPGGRIYLTAMSPFHHGFKEFLPVYNQRWKEKNDWPGVIKNFHDFFPKIKDISPQYVHIMDDRPLIAALERYNFNIDKSSFYDYDRPNKSKRTGKEYYGVIASKPAE